MNAAELQLLNNAVQYIDSEHIAIKPTCELLGIEYTRQFKIIKDDLVLNQLLYICTTTGADGKKYKMVSLSKSGFLRWINGINIKKVNENARENLIKMQLLIAQFIFNGEQKAITYDTYINSIKTIAERIQECKNTIAASNRELNHLYKEQKELFANDPRQIAIDFTEATKQLNA